MQITPSSVDIIRGLKYKITLQSARNLVSIKRLIKSCENKYVILFNPELVNVWVEAADITRKQAQSMQIKTNDPNLWAAALWYLDNNAEVHKLLRQMTPDRKGSKRSGEQVGTCTESGDGFLSLPDRKKGMSHKQMARFELEFMHSFLAAYITYPRNFFLSEAFHEKARLQIGRSIELPNPSIRKVANSDKLYAYLLWTMPEEIDYIRNDESPRVQQVGLLEEDAPMSIS